MVCCSLRSQYAQWDHVHVILSFVYISALINLFAHTRIYFVTNHSLAWCHNFHLLFNPSYILLSFLTVLSCEVYWLVHLCPLSLWMIIVLASFLTLSTHGNDLEIHQGMKIKVVRSWKIQKTLGEKKLYVTIYIFDCPWFWLLKI